jgi:hypothetical protein
LLFKNILLYLCKQTIKIIIMKHLENLSDFALHREGMRVRELIQINREKADLAIKQKLGRKALSFLDVVDARKLELNEINRIQDKKFNI